MRIMHSVISPSEHETPNSIMMLPLTDSISLQEEQPDHQVPESQQMGESSDLEEGEIAEMEEGEVLSSYTYASPSFNDYLLELR